MRIAFVVGKFPLISEVFVLNQVIGLIKLGHEVDIFSFSRGDTKKIHSDVEKYGLLKKVIYLDPLHRVSDRVRETRMSLSEKYSKKIGFKLSLLDLIRYTRDKFLLMKLIHWLRLKSMRPYDIIHCQMGTVGLRFLPLRRLGIFSGKLVVQFRGEDITEFVKQKGEKVYGKLFKEADCFMPVCDYLGERAIALGCPKDKISVLRSGINCKRFIYSERVIPSTGFIRIAIVGRLVGKKGIEYAIRAFSILKKRGYKAELLIVGDGPLRMRLQELSKELNVDKSVVFFGAKNHDEVVEILNKAHLFVAPSVISKNGNEEGIPNVLKEAMAVGLPVVSTYHAGIPELVQDGISGFLVSERDTQSLADKLGYLIDHPEIWIRIGRSGRRFIEKDYNIEKLNKELVDIYRKLIK